jgi:cell division protease FtsH
MVGLWGMSEELGAIWYGVGETHPFLGREIGSPREYAEATAAELDAAVRKIVEQAHLQARSLLEGHRACLDALAAELLAHESVDGQRLDALLAGDGTCGASSDDKEEVAISVP